MFVLFTGRLKYRAIVVNTLANGAWQDGSGVNIKTDPYPYQINVPFELRATLHINTLTVMMVCNDCHVFKYRLDEEMGG